MCHNPDEKYLKELLDYNKQTVHLLSSKMQKETERMVCRAFLRCAGIPFTEERLRIPPDEPPDILFDSAQFEVIEIMDEGRKRHKEYKEGGQRLEKAKSAYDVLRPIPSPESMMLVELIPLITERLKDKFKKYVNKGDRCKLDILVYVNIIEKYFVPTSPGIYVEELDTKNLDDQGWRSVSALICASREIIDNQGWISAAIPVTASQLENLDAQPAKSPLHAVVLTATPTAPNFIRERVGKILNECPDQKRLFEP
jgi:putative endonuclease (uncharacterized protein DUF1780)